MVVFVEMLGCVLVLRRVATANMSADKAQAQVNPTIAHLYTLFADMLGGGSYFDLVEVSASVVHFGLPGLVYAGQVTSVILRKAHLRYKAPHRASQ